MAAQRLD